MVITQLRTVRLGVVLALALIVPAGAAIAQTAPGATPADFSVDASGNAAAQIEIAVPPGPHGVQPKLALAYSSAAKNGVLGVGWTLQGVPAITRGGPSKYYDGDELSAYWNRVSYVPRLIGSNDGSINDRFFLDGQRLIAVKNSSGATLTSMSQQNAAYGKSGTEYHTALESWTKVTSQGTAGFGPQSFVAYQKDGTRLEFGATEDSRIQIQVGASVRVWALSLVRDPNGNTMTFSYTKDIANGEYRLASISYTANSVVSPVFTARNRVDFEYEDRTDKTSAFQGGFVSKVTKRLREIRTQVGTRRIKTYKLSYEYGSATGRSRLASLQECDGAGACMPATNFRYSDFTPNGTFNIMTPDQSIGMRADKVNVYTGDYNGDGRTDFLRQEKGDWANDSSNTFNVYFSNFSNSSGNFQIVTPSGDAYQEQLKFDQGANILPGDFNGDGLTDFLRQEKGGWDNDTVNSFNVYFSLGNGNFNIVTPNDFRYQDWLRYDPGCLIYPADVDGDGVTDFYRQEWNGWGNNSNETFQVYFSNRDGTFRIVEPHGTGVDNYQYEMRYNPGARMFPGDYNGDGAIDFLRQEWNDWDNNLNQNFQVYFSRRDGYSTRFESDAAEYQDKLRYDPGANLIPGDFNGDGLQDFIRQTWNGWDDKTTDNFQVYFSRGDGLFDIANPPDAVYQNALRYDPGAFIIPGDFNGDGLEDFIRQEKGDWANDNAKSFEVYLSRGDGTFNVLTPPGDDYQVRLKGNDSGVVITVGDFNGDGIDDFMARRKNSSDSPSYWVYLSKGPVPDLLTSFTDGLNKTTAIVYKPLTDSSVYTKGSGAVYPVVDEQPTSSVVASFTLSDGNGNSVTQSYTYEALRTRRDGSGVSNFARIHKLDNASGVKQTTEYHQATQLPQNTQDTQDKENAFLTSQVKSISKMQGQTALERTDYTYYSESAAGSRPYTNVSQPLLQRADVKHYVAGSLQYTTRQEYAYGAYGNLTKVVDHGDINVTSERLYTSSEYSNNETTWILGLVTAIKQSKADGSSTTAWDATKDLTWTKRSYDTRGNVLREERYDDQNNAWLANVTGRDGFGDAISSVDPTGNTATLVYDDSHTYVRERHVANGPQPALVTKFAYDTGFGEMTSQTDPNNRTLTYTLDGFGRFTIVQGPRPDNPSQSVELIRREWTNTSQGMIDTTRSRTDWNANYGSITSPWSWEKQYTDGFGRVYKKESLGPDGRTVVEDTAYTPQGWIARRTFPHWSTETGNSLSGLTIEYDARGLPIRMTSGGIVTTIEMQANGKSFTRTEAAGTPLARRSSYTFDSRLKVVNKTDAENQVTRFEYDPLSRPIKVTDPDGVITTTTYTSLGLKRQINDPAAGLVQFSYRQGLLRSQTGGSYAAISYTYDTLSRISQKTVTWSKGWTSQSTVDYEYDMANGAAGFANLTGNLYRVVTRTQGVVQSEYRFGYDAYGQEAVMEVKLDGQPTPFVFRYGYDPLGRKIEQVFPDNARVRTSYEPNGDMAAVALEDAIRGTRSPSKTYTTYRGYTARGEPTRVEYGNGVQAALEFNPVRGMLTRNTMTYGSPSSPSSPKLVDDQYDWDVLGEVTQIRDLRTGSAPPYDPYPFHNATRVFTYTAAGRIATASSPGTYGNLAYTYSPGGDLLTMEGVAYTIGAGHKVTTGRRGTTTVFSAGYDERGNRVTKTGEDGSQWGYAYDGENRLLAITKNSTPRASFEYDHANRRTRKTDHATGTTVWYVAQDYEVTTFGASAGGQTQHTKYLTGQIGPAVSITRPAAEVSLMAVSGASSLTSGASGAGHPAVGTYYLYKDHVGSTHVVSDDSGKVVARTIYKPFGEIDLKSSEGNDIYRAKFGGQEFDGETGLYYFDARYYDATIGRFITPDSVMGSGFLQVDVFNRYAFAGNNPIRNIDPSGHSFLVTLIVGAIVGATVAMATEVVRQGVTNGWGNIQVGKVLVAGIKGAVSGVVAAATGAGASKIADKAVKKLTTGVKKGVERAIKIGVEALAGAAGDTAVQAASNGIQTARGQEVDWARSMVMSVTIGAVASGAGEALNGLNRGSYDVTPQNGKGVQPKPSIAEGVRDHLKDIDHQEWGVQIGVGITADSVSSRIDEFFDNAENNSDTTGNAFSLFGRDNAPAPEFNGRMIINVVAGLPWLSSTLERLKLNGATN